MCFQRHSSTSETTTRSHVNALANFCFLTKDTNLNISDRLPEVYFAEVEGQASRRACFPMDPDRSRALEDRALP